jgi:metallophosphoesterase (TIGR03767 family)
MTPYRAVEIIEGERHLIRDDFGAASPTSADGSTGGSRSPAGRPLGCLVHITDLQLADVQSPARFEFLNRYFADPRYAQIVPVQRPQEALTAHAVDATVRTLNAVSGPATGAAIELAVTTGDAIDNAQWNEVQALLALFDGGLVVPNSGGPGYAGVQSLDWPDDIFWKPDGVAASGPDFFRRAFGFPHHPGLLERAVREFSTVGLRVPWLSCFGNHEALDQGVGIVTEGLAEALVGTRKPMALPEDFDHDRALELLTERPEAFMAGPTSEITADPGRRAVSRQEFVQAHFRPGSRPFGHGFSEQNRLGGTAYYVYDTPAARFIALDTTCLAGGAAGCLDRGQARWLEARLAEVHSAYRGRDGREVATGHDDRLVVLFSHHGTGTLSNTRAGHPGPGGERVLGAADLLALLHRFPNVVLWLNGHTHANSVQARRNPGRPARGFWEVTTCAVIDWPCQTRIVELVDRGEYLSIVCTMVDHDTPAGPRSRSLDATDDLASLHRELAANVPLTGAHHSTGAGTAADRNVELRIAAPFPLGRVSGLLPDEPAGRRSVPPAGRGQLLDRGLVAVQPDLRGRRPAERPEGQFRRAAGDGDHGGAGLGGDPDPLRAGIRGWPVVPDQFDADGRLAQQKPRHAEPLPQHLVQVRADCPLLPARCAAPYVLVVHEVLHHVGPLVHARYREEGQPRRPVPDGFHQPGIGRPRAERALHAPGVSGQRAAHDARSRIRPVLPQHQVRGEVAGGPSLA